MKLQNVKIINYEVLRFQRIRYCALLNPYRLFEQED